MCIISLLISRVVGTAAHVGDSQWIDRLKAMLPVYFGVNRVAVLIATAL